jgi:hypothetical protein
VLTLPARSTSAREWNGAAFHFVRTGPGRGRAMKRTSTATVLEAGDYIKLKALQVTTKFPAETHPAVSSLKVDNSPELTMIWIAPGPA